MGNTTYALVADLPPYLGGSVTSGGGNPNLAALTSTLQDFLNAAAEELDRQTRQSLPVMDSTGARLEAFSASASPVTLLYDDDLTGHGVINLDDFLSVSAVARNGQAVSSTYWLLDPPNALPKTRLMLKLDVASPLVIAGGWYGYPYAGAGLQQISVTGTYGYCTSAHRPTLIKTLTLTLAARAWERVGRTPVDQLLMISAIQNAWQQLDSETLRRVQLLRRDRAVVFA